MESKDGLKETDIKNGTCYYFDDITRVIDVDFSDNLLNNHMKLFQFRSAKPLRIWFDKINGFVKIFDGIKYLVLFDHERYNAVYDGINYVVLYILLIRIFHEL